MKTSIATVSVPGSLDEKLQAIAKAGFDGIEIFEQDFIADTGSPRDVGNRVRDLGLDIALFQPIRDFECLPAPLRTKAFDRAERKFDLMQELGCGLALFCSSCHPQAMGGIDRAAADFHELGERAAARGLKVGYEALAWGRHINDHRDAWEIVRRADHANIGLILDSFHTLGRGIDPESIRAIPGDKIFFVQLADAPKIEMDLLYWSRHFRNMPGEGDLDVTRFLQAVMATGYSGPLSLEIFNDQFRGGLPRIIAADGHRSLMHLMDQVRRAEPQAAGAAQMPAPVRIAGTEFIEFTTRGPEGDSLRQSLTALGFSRTAKHVAKALELWQQGDLRIVVNQEQGDYASSAYNMHGTSICDIGLRVADAPDAVTRATTLGAVPFSQPLTQGQLDIPAIRGLGGSILHLIDDRHSAVWEREFNTQRNGPAGAGLTHVDHIAQTMTYGEMLSWSLFYSSLFGMSRAPMVDVVDPDGLTRSQAVETTDGAFRITLNGAETHRTLAGSFLADSFGAPVQHLAFACDDIFVTAQALHKNGFAPLVMPQNYYRDLAARFQISAPDLERIQAANVLYDEDETGPYYQIYSQPLDNGFFFEIVQRQQYRGYGAANAPFRIAAQKRLMRAKGMPRL
ncbi:3-keto-5-aminohexanoate cleavage protein [Thioclava sp. SK-1]|uniref:bifunctional sugar phosphate isomerase/epimerase/4-hydroxyphenylpyruvate dioxygenase family protein n=1 Tax=Thioclava sp. SK-1 TaxID=1889770 RepID=UPI000826BC5E|nr:sugar phosphate isomerase/epimerase and 4-hydroxyphenylpyruvate domain-containing protein [Thioclava sp. SK-1]OCX67335.1 3-keto-5-aminohexanoate cleavage protein [Thioclava sp. SK-1]